MTTPPAPRPARRIAVLSAAIGVPVVGLGIAAVSLIPMLTSTTTSVSATGVEGPLGITAFDTLNVEPAQELILEDEVWVVPLDADWGAFPLEPAVEKYVNCTEAQRSWLDAEGEYSPKATTYQFTNTATEGSNLSIREIRLEGEFSAPEPSIEVHCRTLGGGQGGVEMVVSSLGSTTSVPAVVDYVESIDGADVSYVEGEQVVFNLRAGDAALLFLYWDEQATSGAFHGDLVATISSGDKEADVALPQPRGSFSLPVATMTSSIIAVNGGVPFCLDGGEDPAAFARIVDALGGCDSTVALAGTWSGDVTGDRNPYSLEVTIEDRGGVYTAVASYPEIPCTATWAETSRTSTTVTFLETVDPGSRCFDQVPVTITVIDGITAGIALDYAALSGGYLLTSQLHDY